MYMTDVPSPRIVVDADLAFPAHKIEGKKCDFILFFFENAGRFLTVTVELKGGNVDASEAQEQLQKGADFANRVMPADVNSICSPILIHEKGNYTDSAANTGEHKFSF